ncbi:putative Ig domain-containing protein [Thiothrix nivea]|uniref:Ig family protein n=1 Tax=Thiothrix nivea (strain ATCC 35100 / DSM 5205 / JP2) TaxID=870187 RepID=A0A656HM15_THINJ|nr:putative Ig domain-containing protein [Thiothrix nivea]EIJ36380.1 Ig family protein [Thiothrix nivea DSM 5205]
MKWKWLWKQTLLLCGLYAVTPLWAADMLTQEQKVAAILPVIFELLLTEEGTGGGQVNHPPVIGGSPSTQVKINTPYTFTPVVTDADGDGLTFSIANRPSWAVFNSATGTLSGTPNVLGATGNITITVSDGKGGTGRLDFAIEIVPPIPLMRDTDLDGKIDVIDTDDDNDNVSDNEDYRPLDSTISVAPVYSGVVNSSAQTYVRQDNLTTNYSGKSFIQLRSINGSYATAGLLYFTIPATLDGKRVDRITEAKLTVQSDTEKNSVNVYATTDAAFPDAASATWSNTMHLFGSTLYGNIPLTAGAVGSAVLSQPISAGDIRFMLDETGNDARNDLFKGSAYNYLDLKFKEVDPEIVNLTQVADSRATQSGGQLVYQVSLTQAPTDNVYVPVMLGSTATATLTTSEVLTFTPDNWSTAQTVVIAGKDDLTNLGSKDNQLLVYPLHSNDSYYNGNNPVDHDFTVYAVLTDENAAAGSSGAAKSGQAFRASAGYSNPNKTASFALVGAPVGMSINEKTGVISWQPDISEVGSYDFSITARENGTLVYNKLVNLPVEQLAANPTDGFYVVPNGTPADANAAQGSIANPYTSIETALAAAALNPVKRKVYVRGGRYPETAVTVDNVRGQEGNEITLTRLPGERVKFEFSGLSAFAIGGDADYVVFDGFEVDGKSINDHWDMLANHWWDPLGDRTIGGGQAFNVDGQHITIKNNVIHDTYQKGVNIYKGRYVNVQGNVVYNIGHSSLSGGHGIMRKWERNFSVNPTADNPASAVIGPDVYSDTYPYRFDITGNLLLAVEQRIYSRVFNKGYANLTIDEGKPMAFDETQDTDPKSRVSNNLVLYGGIDHIRLKQNPNMEVYNNSVLPDLTRTDIALDGITDKTKLKNLKFYGNLVASNDMAIDVGDSFGTVDGDELPIAQRQYANYIAGGGTFNAGLGAGITDKGGTDASPLFADVANNDFRSVVVDSGGAPTGVGETYLTHLMTLANEYGIELKPGGWVHDHLANADTLVANIPADVFDRSAYYIGPSSVEEGHQALFIKFVDTDGKWLYTKREEEGVAWGALANPDLANDSIYNLDAVDIQKCDVCTGAYVFQLVLPHEWFDAHGNAGNTAFSITNSDGTTSQVIYLDPTNADHQIIMDYSAEGKVRSY